MPGIDGMPGRPGMRGSPGNPGMRGAPGDSGTPGSDGTPGVRGSDGTPGFEGRKGTSVLCYSLVFNTDNIDSYIYFLNKESSSSDLNRPNKFRLECLPDYPIFDNETLINE